MPSAPAGPGDDVTGGLVAVHAHPDDETLSTGALLATFAGAGRPVTVVTATRGERGEVIGSRLAHLQGDAPALAAHREAELAGALAALGVQDHVFLDAVAPAASRRYEDSGMVWTGAARAGAGAHVPDGAFVDVPPEVAAERLAAVLRARRPQVVATYDPDGGYGHPDHVRTHEVTMRAVQLAGSADWSPVVLWRRAGAAATAAAATALAAHGPWPERLTLTDPAGETPSVVVPDARVDLAVDVRPVLSRVLDALRSHATQVQAVTALVDDPHVVAAFALSNDLLQPLLVEEGYELAQGDPASVRWPSGTRVGGPDAAGRTVGTLQRTAEAAGGAPSTRR